VTVHTRRCDYEGSTYREDFWEQANRSYEDAADRVALRALLPGSPGRLVEIGAGYGRLADMYGAASEVILVDYATSMLDDARSRLGGRATFVCADLYALPFATRTVDTVVQVRVLHHVEDVIAAFLEVSRIMRTGGSYVLEFANKRHLKAVARYLTEDDPESPFHPAPREFVDLNWNFHPAFIDAALSSAGLTVRARRATSLLRAKRLKERLPHDALARVDALLGGLVGPLAPAPSQYVRAARLTGGPDAVPAWRCPACGAEPLYLEGESVDCSRCGHHWPVVNGIHIFRRDLV
jgi:SAM-dependent methyltransferase